MAASTKPRESCDVLVIGAGMAGACIARQLRLAHPHMRIVNIERKTSFDYWIGESTVEAWEQYMVNDLKLGAWLEKNFITKHGLRFFFDSPEKDLSIEEMSEFGRAFYTVPTARNIDRAQFDQKLADLNRETGIDVRLGEMTPFDGSGIVLDRDGGHRVETDKAVITCRYLIDAGGRASALATKLKLVEKDPRNESTSVWVRVRRFNNIDHLGPREWRRRVNFTMRYNSTNHFMYRGYWFWHIPLSEDVVSIGVEYNPARTPLDLRGKQKFVDFMKSHRCLAQILGDDFEILDFKALTSLPRRCRQFYSTDRWYLTGMAGFFADVMGSGTSRVYGEINRQIGELIRTDLSGDAELLRRQTNYFNAFTRTTYEALMNSLRHYEWYGSYGLFANYFGVGLSVYFNSQFPNAIEGLRLTFEESRKPIYDQEVDLEAFLDRTLRRGQRFYAGRRAHEMFAFLEEHGAYYRWNRGHFMPSSMWESRPEIEEKFWEPRDLAREREIDLASYEIYVRQLITLMCEVVGIPFDEASFARHFERDWLKDQTLPDLLALMQQDAHAKARKRKVAAVRRPAGTAARPKRAPAGAAAGKKGRRRSGR